MRNKTKGLDALTKADLTKGSAPIPTQQTPTILTRQDAGGLGPISALKSPGEKSESKNVDFEQIKEAATKILRLVLSLERAYQEKNSSRIEEHQKSIAELLSENQDPQLLNQILKTEVEIKVGEEKISTSIVEYVNGPTPAESNQEWSKIIAESISAAYPKTSPHQAEAVVAFEKSPNSIKRD